jgi:hypothetical protein
MYFNDILVSNQKIDYEITCPCGGLMILMFYLLSPDTRAQYKLDLS